MQLGKLEKQESEETEEMMAGVSEEAKKRILKQYYENMYEDEDADQEYFDSIRNVNHDVQEADERDEEDGKAKDSIQIAKQSGMQDGKDGKQSAKKSGKQDDKQDGKQDSKQDTKQGTKQDAKQNPKQYKQDKKGNQAVDKPKETESAAKPPSKPKGENPYKKSIERNKLNHHRRERADKKRGLVFPVCVTQDLKHDSGTKRAEIAFLATHPFYSHNEWSLSIGTEGSPFPRLIQSLKMNSSLAFRRFCIRTQTCSSPSCYH